MGTKDVTTTTNIPHCPMRQNLGPMIIECHDYLKITMQDHLNDTTTYKSLMSIEIECYASEIWKHILA